MSNLLDTPCISKYNKNIWSRINVFNQLQILLYKKIKINYCNLLTITIFNQLNPSKYNYINEVKHGIIDNSVDII